MPRWACMAIATGSVACGGGPSAPPPQTVAPAQLVAPAAGPDDVVVAMVGDRRVWGSCVQAQVKRGTKTARAALDECIDFELLGQAAESRGLATDPGVIDDTRSALVRRLLDDWDKTHDANALRAQIDELYKKAGPADIDQPERRGSWHVMVKALKNQASAELDREARELAEQMYAALPARGGLFVSDLEELAKIANPHKLEIVSQAYTPIAENYEGTVPEYKGALFALSEIGQVTPVTKTQYGYHIILMTSLEPAKHVDYKAAEPLLFGIVRASAWKAYLDGLLAQHAIEEHYELLAPPAGEDAP